MDSNFKVLYLVPKNLIDYENKLRRNRIKTEACNICTDDDDFFRKLTS